MAQVTVKINGFVYTVGCEDGQEEHLQAMAAEVDRRIDGIKALGGNSGEVRLLLLASLLLADEIHDLRAEMQPLREAAGRAVAPAPGGQQADAEIGRRLGKLAARAERIAASLEPS
jgi:cell division protein ZapA